MLQKLTERRIWERLLRERLSEPVHLNILALFVALFGSTRAKIYFDLYIRQQYAFGLLDAADRARQMGMTRVTVIEFGVANGAGLLNLCKIGQRITKATGIKFEIYGFDAGQGMPPPRDYRDHPEHYNSGDFVMQNPEGLRARLPPDAKLIIGEITDTVPTFLQSLNLQAPVGFVIVDVDYYWSAVETLKLFDGPSTLYQPLVTLYLDDVSHPSHNPWCGELAAANDFNASHELRKIAPYNNLRTKRLFKNPEWIEHMFSLHILDHPRRTMDTRKSGARILENYQLGLKRENA